MVEALEAGGSVAELRGYRRRWAVAMDNTRDLPGYKYYLDAQTGERPKVYVAFLDLEPDEDTTVNGVVFPVSGEQLAALDNRERSYERGDVTGRVRPELEGRVWAYFGRPEPKARAKYEGVVVQRAYFDRVREGFALLGPDHLARFHASTDDPPVPIRDLRRIDLTVETQIG